MARPKKEPTRLARIKLVDLKRIRRIAKMYKMSVPDFISKTLKKDWNFRNLKWD
jgi:hypothetical protein